MTQIVAASEFDTEQLLDLLRLSQAHLQLYGERHAAAAQIHRDAMARGSKAHQRLKDVLDASSMSSLDDIRAAMVAKEAADEQCYATNNEMNRLFKACQDLNHDIDQMKRYLLQRLREDK